MAPASASLASTTTKANSRASGKEWISSEPKLNKTSIKTPAGGSIQHLEEAGEGIPTDFFDSKKIDLNELKKYTIKKLILKQFQNLDKLIFKA